VRACVHLSVRSELVNQTIFCIKCQFNTLTFNTFDTLYIDKSASSASFINTSTESFEF